MFDPVIFAYGGTIAGTRVSGPEISLTDVLFLTVDGGNVVPPGGSRLGGILYRDVHGTIQGNTVQNMRPGGSGGAAQTFGILVYGDSVVGRERIQIGYGATSQIAGNVVSHHWVNNPSWTSTGILVVGSDGGDVLGNYVFNNGTGIAVMGLTPWGGGAANGNHIVGNTVRDGDYGISLQ